MLPNFNISEEDVCQAIVDKDTAVVRAGMNRYNVVLSRNIIMKKNQSSTTLSR